MTSGLILHFWAYVRDGDSGGMGTYKGPPTPALKKKKHVFLLFNLNLSPHPCRPQPPHISHPKMLREIPGKTQDINNSPGIPAASI